MGAGRPRTGGASMVLLTGPSGSGKSTLAAALAREGWVHLDGDTLAKELYVPGSALLKAMAKTFGASILRTDGSLDAQHLGEIVFPSPARRKALNRLVYPLFLRKLRQELKRAALAGIKVVADVPVYFDLGAPDLGLPVVLVTAPYKERYSRLRAKGIPAARASARARALRFGPDERRGADCVIVSTSRQAAMAQLKAFLRH